MRKFLVGWWNGKTVCTEKVTLTEEMKANQKNFAKIIDNTLNHYHGYYCSEWDIQYWSLIEE